MQRQIIFLILCLLPATLWAQLTGFIEDFNDNILTGWNVHETHKRTFKLAEEEGVLKILYTRTADSGGWDNFNYTPTQPVSVQGYPVISVEVKSDVATKLTFKPVYSNDNRGWLQADIPGDNTWHDVTFNLIAHGGGDLSMIYMYLDGGSTTLSSGTVCFENLNIGDTEPSARVVNLLAVAIDANRVDLTWSCNLPESVDVYHIYRSDRTDFVCDANTLIHTTAQAAYTDSNLVVDQTYFYKVAIVDAMGTELALSSEVSAHTYPPDTTRFEAECATYTGLSLVSDTGASNGEYVQMGEGGSVKWAFQLDEGGWYKVRFGYKNPGSGCRSRFIKNGENWEIDFGWSDVWTEYHHVTALGKGTNSIEIAASQCQFQMDYLWLEAVVLAPQVIPTHNNVYQQFPRELVLKVNTYGRTIQSVTANRSVLDFDCVEYPYEEDAWHVHLSQTSLSALPHGLQRVLIKYDTDESTAMNLHVVPDTAPASLIIIAPYVSHGNSVLLILPTGKTMLIDCGDATWRDRVVIPLLQKNGITKLDYFMLTHYDIDHDGGDRGQTIKAQFDPEHFYDNNDFAPGDTLELEDTRIKILSADVGNPDLNAGSLSFKMEYNGFIYNHGADIYRSSQEMILTQFPDDVRAHVFSANHHFHGTLSSAYIRTMDPFLVFVQAQQAIYARSAYTQVYKLDTEAWLMENNKRLIETLPTLEVGTVVIRANSAEDWSYETYGDAETPLIPYLQ